MVHYVHKSPFICYYSTLCIFITKTICWTLKQEYKTYWIWYSNYFFLYFIFTTFFISLVCFSQFLNNVFIFPSLTDVHTHMQRLHLKPTNIIPLQTRGQAKMSLLCKIFSCLYPFVHICSSKLEVKEHTDTCICKQTLLNNPSTFACLLIPLYHYLTASPEPILNVYVCFSHSQDS